MRTSLWIVLLCALTSLLGCSNDQAPTVTIVGAGEPVGFTREALTTLDTTPRNATVSTFGPSSIATFGQIITAPATDVVLASFAFDCSLPATVVFRGELYAWDGTKATGASLYESGAVTTTGTTAQVVTFNTGNVKLTAGAQYVLFISSSKDAGTGGGSLGLRSDNPYAGGSFVYVASGTTPATWTSNAWGNPGAAYDLAFKMTLNPQVASSTAVVSSGSPSVFGQSVTLTATVSGTAGTPTGTATFLDGATTLGTATLNGAGQASFSTSSLSVGTHAITVSYGGDAAYTSSTSPALSQVVTKAATTTALSSSTNPSIVGGGVTFTATVAPVAPGAGTPTGTVTFAEGATTLGTGTVSGAGVATFTTSALAVGGHDVTASYGGDVDFGTSASPAVTQTVNRDGATVAVGGAPNPSTFGASVTVTATVTSNRTGGVPTGTVAFSEGATALGTGTLDGSGVATFATAALAGGSHTLTASYAGDATHATATGSYSQVVNVGASTTSVTSATNPSVFGQSVTFTATVSGAGGIPSGTVTFLDGATTLGTGTVNGAGQATFTTSGLGVGVHSVTASYGGNGNFGASASSAVSQTVAKADTSTELASSSNPAIVGTSVTFTATVTVKVPGAGSPTGTVTFRDGTTVLGTGTLSGAGVATYATAALAVGPHTITASYGGDASFTTSASAGVSEVVSQDAVTATLASSLNPSTFGATVTFTATVASSGSGGTPTGSVTFKDGTTPLGSGTLDAAGKATLATATLTGGSHSITAVYGGDVNHAGGSSAAVVQIVNAAATATTVSSSDNPSVFGQSVTFTAKVTSGASGTPTGTVTFKDGTTTLGTGAVSASGSATLTTAALVVATHAISAVYGGDASYATSTSTALAQIVNKAATTTVLASSSNPSLVGASVTFTATVTATAPGAGTPSGTVTFTEGATTLGTGTLGASGTATFATSTLAVGPHAIVASYGGSAGFDVSASSALAQVVGAAGASVVLAASPNPATYGAAVTFSAVVTGASGTPTGSVTFKDGTTTLGTGTVAATGTATFATTSALAAGTHTIEADYGGSATYASATASVSLLVELAETTTTLASSRNPSTVGDIVTFTATVASAAAGLTGEVEFFDGSVSLGKGTFTGTTATLAAAGLTQGGHSITAAYGGDANFSASTSSALTQTVNAAPAGDAGVPDAGVDAGAPNGNDGGTTPGDAGDTSSGGVGTDSGCGCRTAATPRPAGGAALLALATLGLALARARRRR